MLFSELNLANEKIHFDLIIIGSGYGGVVSAEQFSGLKKPSEEEFKVCVLERGKEFRPSDFPAQEVELPSELRITTPSAEKPLGNLEGLYDLRIGDHLHVFQANGLGGGSLINAGVLERPKSEIFNHSWPNSIRNRVERNKSYNIVEELLGVRGKNGSINTIMKHDGHKGIRKRKIMQNLAAENYRDAALSIAFTENEETSAGVKLSKCNLCGDCASGCNFGAKNSLDHNLLHSAYRLGAKIFTGATVMTLAKESSYWSLGVVFTDEILRNRAPKPVELKATNVILAAGALGSTELLKRSESETLKFSPNLGRNFSSNGDMLIVGYDQAYESNSLGDELIAPQNRKIGPCITGIVDRRGNNQKGVLIEEMAVPASVNRLFSEVFTTVDTLHSMGKMDLENHSSIQNDEDPLAVNAEKMSRTSLYAAMGDDGANGRLTLPQDRYKGIHLDSLQPADQNIAHEGIIQINWPELKDESIFETQVDLLQELSKDKVKGKIIPTPSWKLFPKTISFLNKNALGAPISVHPLGGCGMADNIRKGVVDSCGRVFDALGTAHAIHIGLYVMDGAIIPTALGVNPALTIAALSYRASKEVIHDLNLAENAKNPLKRALPLPPIKEGESVQRKDTQTQIVERLTGPLQLKSEGKIKEYVMEITLKSNPKRFSVIPAPGSKVPKLNEDKLVINPSSDDKRCYCNIVRIYTKEDWDTIRSSDQSASTSVDGKTHRDNIEVRLQNSAVFAAKVSGHVVVLGRGKTNGLIRSFMALGAFAVNRGFRDLFKRLFPRDYEKPLLPRIREGFLKKMMFAPKAASHAGEKRTLRYNLEVGKNSIAVNRSIDHLSFDCLLGQKLLGEKVFTYSINSNPWKQLSEVFIKSLPEPKDKKWTLSKEAKLSLDTHHLARTGIPLMRLAAQDNHVTALLDILSFILYLVRMIVMIHFWSFRNPELPNPRKFDPKMRFAGVIEDLPVPEIITLTIDKIRAGGNSKLFRKDEPVDIRLTGYRHTENVCDKPPILMIHGYSASSSTFTHSSIPMPLAKYFFTEGRDVWTLDLRTSSAFKSAKYPWRFEDVAENDIPQALNHLFLDVYKNQTKIDVIAHCMGAAMLGMAILKPPGSFTFSDKINSIILSQATPLLSLTPDNTMRSLGASFVKDFVDPDYQFRPKVGEQDRAIKFLDRALSTLPYHEKLAHNPWKFWKRNTYARTRHRMDAIYGRTFNLGNMAEETLDSIDELFGPLSIETVTQVAQFGLKQTITTREGKNEYVSIDNLEKHWADIPTLHIHSRKNGLIDFSTSARTKDIFNEAKVKNFQSYVIDDKAIGHQDSIVGMKSSKDVFPHMKEFLQTTRKPAVQKTSSINKVPTPHHLNWMLTRPSYGPVIVSAGDKKLRVMAGLDEIRNNVPILLVVPVIERTGKYAPTSEKSLETAIRVALSTDIGNNTSGAHWVAQDFTYARSPKVVGELALFLYSGSEFIGTGLTSSQTIPIKNLSSVIDVPELPSVDNKTSSAQTTFSVQSQTPSTTEIEPQAAKNANNIAKTHSFDSLVENLVLICKGFFASDGSKIAKLKGALIERPIVKERQCFVFGWVY